MGTRRKHKKGRRTRRGGVKGPKPSQIRTVPTDAEKRAMAAALAPGRKLDRRGQDVLLHGSLLSPKPEQAEGRAEKVSGRIDKGFGDAFAAAAARKAEQAQLMD